MFNTAVVLSVLPFLLFLLLLLWQKKSLVLASGASLALMVITAIFYWRILPGAFLGASIKGLTTAFEIFLIIFGAVFFLEILKKKGIIESICFYLESFSKDYRFQVILLAWFFENFLEGMAGFGTPAAIVAPLLIGMGLSPLKAVILALLGNSTAGVFGAVGTPIRLGLAELANGSVAVNAARFNLIGLLVPVFMLWILLADQPEKRRQFFEALPFALWSGIAFVVPAYFLVFIGQEFASILGSIVGLVLIFLTLRLKIFLPRNERDPHPAQKPANLLPLIRVVFPYFIFITLLVLGKIFFGTSKLFNPGIIFIFSGLLTLVFFPRTPKLITVSFKEAWQRSRSPFFVIAAMSVLVQILLKTPSLIVISQSLESRLLPFFTPFIGAFGAFLTGSVTLSNIMFANFLATAGRFLQMDLAKILALQLVGAAAGNMIALADILAAESVVGLKNQERSVLKGVLGPCLIYLVLAGAIGLLVIY